VTAEVKGPDGLAVACEVKFETNHSPACQTVTTGTVTFTPQKPGDYRATITADDSCSCANSQDGAKSDFVDVHVDCCPQSDSPPPPGSPLRPGCSAGGCASKPGSAKVSVRSVSAQFSMGTATDGKLAGYITLYAQEPSADLAKPSGLVFYSDLAAVHRVLVSGVLRQVKAPQALADIHVDTNYKYEIRFYPDGTLNGGLYDPVGSRFMTWVIENPNGANSDDELWITKYDEGDNEVVKYEYTHSDSGVPTWTMLVKNDVGTTIAQEVATTVVDGDVETRTWTIEEYGGADVYKVQNEFTKFGGPNDEIWLRTKQIVDPDEGGAQLTTEWDYYTDVPDRVGLLKSVKHPDGSWEWRAYDEEGRPEQVNSAWSSSTYAGGFIQNPDEDDARCLVYTYDETTGRVASVTEKVLGTTVGLTGYVYTSNAGHPVTTIKRYPDPTGSPNAYLSTTYTYVDSDEDRYISIQYPDGRKDYYSNYVNGYFHYSNHTFDQTPTNGVPAVKVEIKHGTTTSENGVANKATKDVLITTDAGVTLMEETWVHTGSGSFERIAWAAYDLDSRERPEKITRSDGTVHDMSWTCCGLDYEIDENGVRTNYYEYDALGRVGYQIQAAADECGEYPPLGAIRTDFTYDAYGHVTATEVSGGGKSTETSTTYDLAGRVTSRTDSVGLETTYDYSDEGWGDGDRIITVTRPNGADEITEYYRDGRAKSVTGAPVIDQYYDYGVNSEEGTTWTKVVTGLGLSSPRYVKTTHNAVGQIKQEERPRFGTGSALLTTYTYDSSGRLQKVEKPGLADTLYEYDSDTKELVRTGLDVDGGGLGKDSNTSTDRITETDTRYDDVYEDGYWRVTKTWQYREGDTYPDILETTPLRVQRERLTGLSGVVRQTEVVDIKGNVTVTTRTINRTTKVVTDTVNTPDTTYDQYAVTRNGLVQKTVNHSNLATTYQYDGIGRQTKVKDPRGNETTTAFNSAGQVASVENAHGDTTSYEYYGNGVTGAGRIYYVTNDLGNKTYFDYDLLGRTVHTWGDVPQPTAYDYDDVDAGGDDEIVTLNTFRGGSGWDEETWAEVTTGDAEVTAWTYDAATGLLTQKDSQGESGDTAILVSYSYTAEGRLYQRTWDRGVTTTYGYDSDTGELLTVTYSDDTPDVTYTYTRLGRLYEVTDAVGKRTFAYTGDLELDTETFETDSGNLFSGKIITYNYAADSLGRLTRLRVGVSGTPGANYDAQYTYSSATGRMATVTGPGMPSGASATYTYRTDTDLVEQVLITDGSSDYTRTERLYEDHRDLVTWVDNSWYDGDMWEYVSRYEPDYDDLGRVSCVYREGGVFQDGMHHEVYGYDARNELTTSDYYTGGNNVPAKDFIYAYDAIGNRTAYRLGPEQNPTTTYCPNGLNQYDTLDDDSSTCPPQGQADETLDYDEDGNLTQDGTFKYTWDAENRLIQVEPAGTPQIGDKMLTFVYDYLGRRVEKKVYTFVTGNPSHWSTTASPHLRFVWGGWLMLAELNGASSNAVVRKYTWGLDLAGLNGQVNSLEGAGGIGGLLAIQTPGPAYYLYFCDANGNVGQVFDPNQYEVAAKYEYDPYGNLTASTDNTGNPFRFSSKLRDSETGLYYFGYRYYSPRLGRWISRDPIGELGGANLYGYVRNCPATGVDARGEVGDQITCDAAVEGARQLKKVKCLLAAIFKMNANQNHSPHCPIPYFRCKCCGPSDPPGAGWLEFSGGYIMLCWNRLPSKAAIEQAVIHELMHHYDFCHNAYRNICAEIAHGEMRAMSASGECEPRTGFAWLTGETKEQCIKRRAAMALRVINPACSPPEAYINQEYGYAVNDLGPSDCDDPNNVP
jgi:RHS repeat-associated protein